MRLDQAKDRTIQKILGNLFKIGYIGALWSSLRREDCNFIKHGHVQLFSTTRCPPFALRKRFVWRRRRSYSTRFALPRDCHGLYSNRIRTAVNRINENKTHEHLMTNPANQGTIEYLVYTFLQSNSRIQIAKTRSKSWLRSSRPTRTRNHSYRTWCRRRRSTSSVKNRRSPTWTTLRSSNFARPHPRSSAPIVIYTGDRHCLLYLRKIFKTVAKN